MRVTSHAHGTHIVAKAMRYQKQASKKIATFTHVLIEKWFFAHRLTQMAIKGQLSPFKLLDPQKSI